MHTTCFYNHPPADDTTMGLGLQTAYNDIGKGEAFVLVHGYTGSKLDFQDQLPWFADRYRVIAIDQRGHGESSNLGPYSLNQSVTDLIRFLDGLDIERCHLLGHSLGGMVVMRTLLDAPQRFASAILMDTAPHGITLYPENIRKLLNQKVADEGCATLLEGMQGQPQNSATQRGIDYLGEAEHWRRIRTKLEQMDPAAFAQLGMAISEQAPVTEQLSEITLPVSIIVGSEDKPFVGPAKLMQKKLPDSQLLRIKKAGHCPQYENAEAWRAAVDAHFAFAGNHAA
ncbi:MAG: alpha/beta hydrolase [Pseudomonadaceae bacterium]|nr:alpha/beta hydrolase [Pseudomonadaceae bacterium]